MMAKITPPTTKRVQIDKANVTVVTVVAITAFITIFSLVSIKALWERYEYQSRVISAREKAREQLKKNIAATEQLTESYNAFVGSAENVIGGSSTGSGPSDGDNARILLDALPSKYDFPALATSLEKLAKDGGLQIESITGVDDEINQAQNSSAVTPQAVDMPFELSVKGNNTTISNLIKTFERSIRPFYIQETTLTAGEGDTLSLSIKAKTYYQPEKSLKHKSEVVQ